MRFSNSCAAICRLLLLSFASVFFSRCTSENEEVVPAQMSPEPVTASIQRVSFDNISCSSCDFVIPAGTSIVNGKALGVRPGDVICLQAGLRPGRLTFEDINGTADAPVIVTNCGGTVTLEAPGAPFVLRFNKSTHLRVTGGESENSYGIRITRSEGNGLVMGYLTSDFEVDHLEVFDVGFSGIMAKTDPSCDDATIRGNYTMRNVKFHHNYIHDTHGEGFYIGHTSFMGKETACGMRLPHTIENVEVYANRVRNTGWDGIQVSSAPVGARIYDNVVENYGTEQKASHNLGIIIGGGTGGVCYNNYVRNGSGTGIAVFGLADNLVYNNVITDAGSSGIFCDERTPPGKGYKLINNTIINPKQYGVMLYSEAVPENLVLNNVILNPGMYRTDGERAYIRALGPAVRIISEKNFLAPKVADAAFVGSPVTAYSPRTTSPLVDIGTDVSAYGITEDFYGNPRRAGAGVDAGAAEAQ